MGKCLKFFSVLMLLVWAIMLPGREARPVFSPVKVNFRLIQAPRIKAGSVSSANRGNLNLVNRRWGVVEISYTPRLSVSGKKANKSQSAEMGLWLDNLICGVRVVACDRQNKKAAAWALFSTKVEFWTVALDAKEHKYFVYLPPMLIERVMPFRRSDSKQLRIAAENNFVVAVTFFHKTWGVISEGFYGLKGRDDHEEFKNLANSVPGVNVFHGSLISRSNSPWGLNDQEQFDLEKPAFIPAPLDEAAIDKAAEAAASEEAASADNSRKSSASASGKKSRKSKR
jgi:hypothetical protein